MTSSCLLTYNTSKELPDFKPNPDVNPVTDEDVDILEKCFGSPYLETDDLDSWEEFLNEGKCKVAISTFINTPPDDSIFREYNSINFLLAQQGMEYAFSKLFSTESGREISLPKDSPIYTELQESLYDLCGSREPDIRGICNLAQDYMCSECTREDLDDKPHIQFCGCYVKPDQLSIDNGISYQCDTLCSMGDVFKVMEVETGIIQTCNKPVCVINDISIKATGSVLGNLSFVQMCPFCAVSNNNSDSNEIQFISGPLSGAITGVEVDGEAYDINQGNTTDAISQDSGCICIIDASIPSIGQKLGLDNPETFGQYCGSKSLCIQVDNITGVQTTVVCKDVLSGITPNVYVDKVPLWTWIIAAIIIFLCIFVIIIIRSDKAVKLITKNTSRSIHHRK